MMGGRKFFVTVVAVFSLLTMCLPAYSGTIPYDGSVDTSSTDNPLNIDGIIWRYDSSLTYDGSDDTLPFEVDFYSGSNLVLSFVNNGAQDPAIIVNNTYVKYNNGTYDNDPGVQSATLDIDDFVDSGSIYFSLTGNDHGDTINVEGTINFTPIPIPGAIWLLGSGMIGLVGLRKRFRRS